MPPTPRSQKVEPLKSVGRPAPLKRQPLPAYGPYKTALSPGERRVVIAKRTPKVVEMPSGPVATGGGGVGFFTKGPVSPLLIRAGQRALGRQEEASATREAGRVAAERLRASSAKAAGVRPKVGGASSDAISGIADQLGLDNFYKDTVLPTVGHFLANQWKAAKATKGASLFYNVSPSGLIATTILGSSDGAREQVSEKTDIPINLTRAAAGIAKTKGWDNAKPYVAPAIDVATSFIKEHGPDAADFLHSAASDLKQHSEQTAKVAAGPVGLVVGRWAQKNAVEPGADFVANQVSAITNSDLNKRLATADAVDKETLYRSNDISPRDAETESRADPARRESWVSMALGESGRPSFAGYKSPFTRDQLERMSDYELINAAYGTHTNVLSAIFAAAKNDFKKIASAPAAIGAFSRVLDDAAEKGDYRGLGNIAEFTARQAVANVAATINAGVYAGTLGQVGDYKPLVRALQTEPILTGLDVIATASGAGKIGTVALKTGGAAAKVAAVAGRVPGVVRGVEAAGAVAGRVPGATAVGRGVARGAAVARDVADTATVDVRSPYLAVGGKPGVALTLKAKPNLISQAATRGIGFVLGRTRLGTPVLKYLSGRDIAAQRAFISHVVATLGNERARPVVNAFSKLIKDNPRVAEAVAWDLIGGDRVKLPAELGGDVLEVGGREGAALRASQLEDIQNGRAWVRKTNDGDDVVAYGDNPPPLPRGEQAPWRRIVTQDKLDEIVGDRKISDAELEANYRLLTGEEQGVLATNREFFTRLSEISDEELAAAKAALDESYASQFGDLPGRIKEKAPSGTLREILRRQELENQREFVAAGREANPNIADLPEGVAATARERLGIAEPVSPLSRRAKDMSFMSRLLDETVARITPALDPKIRAEVEAILEEELPKAERVVKGRKLSTAKAKKALEAAKVREGEADKLKAENAADRALLKELKDDKSALATRKKKAANARITKRSQRLDEIKRVESKFETASKSEQEAVKRVESLVAAQENIDSHVDSLMRDLLEQGDVPSGGTIFLPTNPVSAGARFHFDPAYALAGRLAPREMEKIHLAQYSLLADSETINKFAGSIARNLRMPFVAYKTVNALTQYLMRTGEVLDMPTSRVAFNKAIEEWTAAGLLNNGGEKGTFVALELDPKTGFLSEAQIKAFNEKGVLSASAGKKGEVGVDEGKVANIIADAMNTNSKQELKFENFAGKKVVVLDAQRYQKLVREIQAAGKDPNVLQRLTRLWVRVTLGTLPRTPVANIFGSAFLSGLGNGFGGYFDAYRMFRNGVIAPEIADVGLAGAYAKAAVDQIPGEARRLRRLQQYMDYIYSWNVMGEDFSRMVVFIGALKRGLKDNPEALAQLENDLKAAGELQVSFQRLLEHVAKGDFANKDKLPDNIVAIRNDALDKAQDFLGGTRGLTAGQRHITTVIPFWSWYKHILKLYFYTLPTKYPIRSIAMQELARIGHDESARQGFYDGFWPDAIRLTDEVFGSNVYAVGARSNIYPFTISGLAESEGAPGAAFIASNVSPVFGLPFRMAGGNLPGQTFISSTGETIKPGDITAPGAWEAYLAEAEKLIAPVGLVQSTLFPRTSLLVDIKRGVTGEPIPSFEPRGGGQRYAVTPRGIPGLGVAPSVMDLLSRGIGGVSIVREPVRGPVAQRRLREKQQTALSTARANAKG